MRILFTISLVLFFSIRVGFAHQDATGIVKERMDAMIAIKGQVKKLVPIIRRQKDYDAAIVKESAAIIATHSGENLLKLFPEGSLQPVSEASEEIWKDWDEFKLLAIRMETLAKGLGVAADNGFVAKTTDKIDLENLDIELVSKMSVDKIFVSIAQTCSACHEDFRVKKN